MERVGIFFKLRPGAKDEYIKSHDEIWPEVREVLSAAGIRNFSIWNEGNMLFSYYEVKNSELADKVLSGSEIYRQWRNEMEKFVYIDPDSGQKEWFMKQIFLHQ